MKRSGPDDQPHDLRRLPKYPGREGAPPKGTPFPKSERIDEHPQTAAPMTELSYETLPDPFPYTRTVESASPCDIATGRIDERFPTDPEDIQLPGRSRNVLPATSSESLEVTPRRIVHRADEAPPERGAVPDTITLSLKTTRSEAALLQNLPSRTAAPEENTGISDAVSTPKRSRSSPIARVSTEIPAAPTMNKRDKFVDEAKLGEKDTGMRTLSRRRAKEDNTKAIVGMALASAALITYAFQIGALETAADAAAGHLLNGGSVVSTMMPWLLVLPALLLFAVIIWFLLQIIGLRQSKRKNRRTGPRKPPPSPLHEFKAAAFRHGVNSRTAYRGWRLLEATCTNGKPVTVDSSLTNDLGLTHREIRAVHMQLLADQLRANDLSMRLPDTETVLDLLKAVERAPVLRSSPVSGEVTIPGDPGQRKRRT